MSASWQKYPFNSCKRDFCHSYKLLYSLYSVTVSVRWVIADGLAIYANKPFTSRSFDHRNLYDIYPQLLISYHAILLISLALIMKYFSMTPYTENMKYKLFISFTINKTIGVSPLSTLLLCQDRMDNPVHIRTGWILLSITGPLSGSRQNYECRSSSH